jgi:hypothetical protein
LRKALVAFTDECDQNPSCPLYRPSIEMLNLDKKSLNRIKEFLQDMSEISVEYKENAVPGFTVANIFEQSIKEHLVVGFIIEQMASALDLAMNGHFKRFLSMALRTQILEIMGFNYISDCPDQATEKKPLDEWFGHHSKNNIAPSYLLW